MTVTNIENIPPEMQALKRWCFYRVESPRKPGAKPPKVPYQRNGQHAKSNDPATWVDFSSVTPIPAGFDGINFAFAAEDRLFCIDLDHARNPQTGEPEPWASEIIQKVNSYTEASASGTGYHIIARGTIPKSYHQGNIEIYNDRKFISITGDVEELRFGIQPCDISWLTARLEQPQTTTGDASKDDFILACRLARENGCDEAKTLAAFLQQSRQDPKKLERPDYAPRTVQAAIARVKSKPLVEPATPLDWRTAFRDPATLQTGDVRMLIKGILPEGVTMIGSNSGVGKTWMAVSALKALITGERYLGVFEVPERQKVLYLIPEVGDRSLRYRLERMRVPLDGSLFRVRTLADGTMHLNDPLLLAAVAEWQPVCFFDTAIRFGTAKDENSAAENSPLADALFCLIKNGARAVVGLHHSPKGTAKAEDLTLENVLRGTGDLGAMCDAVWGLQHDRGKQANGNSDEYVEESRNLTRLLVKCVKPRDFEPVDAFRIQGRPYIDETGDFALLTGDNEEAGAIPVSKADKAADIVAGNPKISKNALARQLGVCRNNIESLLAERGWTYKQTSHTSGYWERKSGVEDLEFDSA